ncbi:olfactory receptor 10AC1-like [Eubalaena glacialis]|uniref:olfactory receptor 10AC1-like n=1 Tax=Eubalaena glacialis TaxID=27606 RepID=UPI002A5A909B|nr:olfactory receptor 10AC1-like [Eubalaena glacialis]XP_061065467.1 olfactory receptor 10AC1-like [Eubalaena glacialis]
MDVRYVVMRIIPELQGIRRAGCEAGHRAVLRTLDLNLKAARPSSTRPRHEPLAHVKLDRPTGVCNPGLLRAAPGAPGAALRPPPATRFGHTGRKPADPGPGCGGRRPAPTTYFFLRALSAEEAAYTPVLTLRALAGLLLPPGGHPDGPLCGSGCLLLAAMALGHYPAVCRPRLTTAGLCWCLLAACCVGGSLLALGLTTAIFQLPFRHGGLVHHVFCDLPAVLVLASGNRDLQEHVLLAACLLLPVLPLD